MGNVKKETLQAYADSANPDKSFEDTRGERDLNFLASKPVSVDWAIEVMEDATPNGYNYFDPEGSIKQVAELFKGDPQIILAREGSVCIYVIGSLKSYAYGVLSDDGSLVSPQATDADEYSAYQGREFVKRVKSKKERYEDNDRRSPQQLTDEVQKAVKDKTVHRFWWD